MSKLRIGFLSTAHIGKKNWKAIFNSGNCVVSAVASRSHEKGREFVEQCQREFAFETRPAHFGSYEEMISSRDVDAIYIPLPTGLRKEWVLRAAGAGKHVLCEKPCAINLAELEEMLAACRQNRVQFLDGVMFMHNVRLPKMREVLDDGASIGQIQRISSNFSFYLGEEFFRKNIRADGALEPAGCLGDLGWYCIRFALWVMDWTLPRRVTGRILSEHKSPLSPAPAITEFSGELFFDGGVSSTFYCSFITSIAQWANIIGTRGCLHVPDFVLPYAGSEAAFETISPELLVQGCDFNMEPHACRWALPEHSHSHPTAQETNMFRDFVEQVRSGQLNPSWPDMALKTQQVMQACRESALAGHKLPNVS